LKIIHIVENLDKGAVENWLVPTFIESRNQEPNWEWTFFCILGKKGRLDTTVIEGGGKIIYSPCSISQKLRFVWEMRKVLIKGKYDIIHAHHDFLSGFYLLATIGLPFKKRILHIHNTDRSLPVGSKKLEKILLKPFWYLSMICSDYIIGNSKHTLGKYLSESSFVARSNSVLYYGVDFSKFQDPKFINLRKELNIEANGKIMLFIGRMNNLKNPIFLIPVLKKILQKKKDIHAVFVGKGEQEQLILEKSDIAEISSNVHLLDWRDDIPSLLNEADIFVFPRIEFPKEGLGLVIIEAQAAGIPILMTSGIVPDAIVDKELVSVLPLDAGSEVWANKILGIITASREDRKTSLSKMKRSLFDLNNATINFLNIYQS